MRKGFAGLSFIIGAVLLTSIAFYGLFKYGQSKVKNPNVSKLSKLNANNSSALDYGQVLAASDEATQSAVYFNIPAIFNKDITAPNVIYGLRAGVGITLSGDKQTPTISANSVTIGGQTGAIALGTGITINNGTISTEIAAGNGISVSGNTVTNTGILSLVAGNGISVDGNKITSTVSQANSFSTISVSGQNDITAGFSSDALTFVGGTGVTLTTDSTNKKLTITNTSTGGVTSLFGTSNQVIVSASAGAITLSLPQDIATSSTPTFGGATFNGNVTFATSAIAITDIVQKTSSATSLTLQAGSDQINFYANGRLFQFPSSGGASQTICTTGITCASGGGQAVLLAPGSAQTDNTADASIFINDTGGGNLLELQNGGSDVFTVGSGGVTTVAGGIFLNGDTRIGNASTDRLAVTAQLLGTTPLVFQGASDNGFSIGLAVQEPTANVTYRFADTSAGTYDICTSAGNCVGGAGGAPGDATYLTLSTHSSLSNERVLTAGSNISTVDTGSNGTLTVNVYNAPTFSGLVTAANGLTVSSGVFTAGSAITTSLSTGAISAGSGSFSYVSTSGIGIVGNALINGSAIVGTIEAGNANLGTTLVNGTLTAGSAITSSLATGAINANALILGSGNLSTSGSAIVGNLTTIGNLTVAGNTTLGDNSSDRLSFLGQILGTAPLVFQGASDNAFSITLGIQEPTANVTYRFADTTAGTYDICTSAGNCVGGGGSAPSSASYLTLGSDGSLSAERVLTAGSNISFGDTGANGTLTINLSNSPTISGTITAGSGLYAYLSSTGGLAVTGGVLTAGSAITSSLNTGIILTSGSALVGTIQAQTANLGTTLVNGVLTAGSVISSSLNTGAITGTSLNLGSGTITGGSAITSSLSTGNITTSANINAASSSIAFINTIRQTGTGNAMNFIAGSDQINFYANGITFNFPTTGGSNQTICTSGVTCASGGGTAVLLGYGSAQVDTTSYSSIWINDTGGGNLLQFQSGGSDVFVIGSGGNTTIGGALTLNADVRFNSGSGTYIYANKSSQQLELGKSSSIDGKLVFYNTSSSNSITLQATSATGSFTLNVPSLGAGSYDICTSSGNCVGSGGGGAPFDATYLTLSNNGSLSNERVLTAGSNVNFGDTGANGALTINVYNSPKFSGTVTAASGVFSYLSSNGGLTVSGNTVLGGSSTDRVSAIGQFLGTVPLVFQGASDNSFTTSLAVEEPTANATYRFPTASGTYDICTSSGNCVGSGGGGAPFDATYLTLSNNGSLSNERVFTAGSNIAFDDTGANGTLTVRVINSPTFSGTLTAGSAITSSLATGGITAGSGSFSYLTSSSIGISGNALVNGSAIVGTIEATNANLGATNITGNLTVSSSAISNSVITNGVIAGSGAFSYLSSNAIGISGNALVNGSAIVGTIESNYASLGTVNAASLSVQSSGVASGTLYGLNISAITGGSGIETAIKIGSGWDAVLSVNGNTIIDGNGNIVSGVNAVNTIGLIDSQSKSSNGAVISGNTLYLQTADATFPGLVIGSAQTFAGSKTFTGAVTTFQPVSDSTSAFIVKTSGGSSVLNADTTNGRVGIGTNAPVAFLEIKESLSSSSAPAIQISDTNASAGYLKIGDVTSIAGDYIPYINAKAYASATAADRVGLFITAQPGEDGTDDGALVIDGNLNGVALSNAPLIRIQNNGTLKAEFNPSGQLSLASSSAPTADLTFGNGADRTINVLTRSTNAAGNNLTVQAGTGGSGNNNGGNLILQGGDKTGNGTPGSVIVKPQTDSTTAFQVLNTNGSGILTIDTQTPSLSFVSYATSGISSSFTNSTFTPLVGNSAAAMVISFADNATNQTGSTQTTGLVISATVNTSGIGNKEINEILLNAPTITKCQSGVCSIDGIHINTIANGGLNNIASNGININASGINAGSLNAINIGAISAGAGSETAINIGSGWDAVLKVNGNTIIDGNGNLTAPVLTIGTIDSQTKSTNGAVISGTTLYMQTADVTNPGLVSASAQTFAGLKTFSQGIIVNDSGIVASNNLGTALYINGAASDIESFIVTAPNVTTKAAFSLQNIPLSTDTNTGKAFEIKVAGESFARVMFYTDGKLGFGSGGGTRDVFLSRSNTGELRISGGTDNGISGTGGLVINSYLTVGSSSTATSGNIASFMGYNLAPTVGQSANIMAITFTDSSVNPNGTTTTNGLYISPTINASGAGNKNINGISIATPTITACQSGICTIDGVKVHTIANGAANNITSNGLDVQSSGIASGILNGLNISAISAGSGAETAINIGSGWDAVLKVNGNTIIDGNGNIAIATGVTTVGQIDSQTKSTNGAVISGNSLYLQSADSTYPGLVTGSAQTFAGAKTLTGALTLQTSANTSGALTLKDSSGNSMITVDNRATSRQVDINLLAGSNLNAEVATWTSGTSLSTATGLGGSVYTNGYIYMVGGTSDGSTPISSNNVQYAKVNSDGSIGSWAATSSLNNNVWGAGVVSTNGYIYSLGGDGTNVVQYSRIKSDGTVPSWSTTTALPANLRYAAVTAANGYIYLFGGNASGTSGTNTGYYGKVNADGTISSWTTVSSPFGGNLMDAAAVVANNYIYIIGGGTTSGAGSNTVYYATLNPSTGAPGSFSTTSTLPQNLANHSAVVVNGYIYAIGSSTGTKNVIYYAQINRDGTVGTWQTNSTNLWGNLYYQSSVVINGYIYTLGGNSGGYTTNVYYASTARVRIGGSLDLVGLGNPSLNDSNAGSSLTVGNAIVAGALSVSNDANFQQSVNVAGNLTTNGLALLSAATTGNASNILATSLAPAVGASAAAMNITFADGSVTQSGTTTTNGLLIAATVNTSGSGSKAINGINLAAPVITKCSSGTCVVDGLQVNTIAAGAASNIWSNGLDVQATGIGAGTLTGLNISAISAGAGSETAINIGSGWDAVLKVNGNTIIDGNGNIVAGISGGVTSIGQIDSQSPALNGATISGTTLYLQSAGATYPGLVNQSAQTFAGAKTFNSQVTINNQLLMNGSGFSMITNASGNLYIIPATQQFGGEVDITGPDNLTTNAVVVNLLNSSNGRKFQLALQNGSSAAVANGLSMNFYNGSSFIPVAGFSPVGNTTFGAYGDQNTKFAILGGSDMTQFLVRAFSTQTTDIMTITSQSGTSYWKINSSGNVVQTGSLNTTNASITAGSGAFSFMSAPSIGISGNALINGSAIVGTIEATTANIGNTTLTGNLSATSILTSGISNSFTNSSFAPLFTAGSGATAVQITFADNATNQTGSTIVNGLELTPTVNTSGQGAKYINGIALDTPTITKCNSGNCFIDGLQIHTIGAGAASNIFSNGINIQSSGIAAGILNALNISAITSGSGIETAIKIGSGWDAALSVNGNPVIDGNGNISSNALSAAVLLAPASQQTDSSTNNAIVINKTGASGNILELMNNGSDVMVLGNTGILTSSTSNTSGVSYSFTNSSFAPLFTAGSGATAVQIVFSDNAANQVGNTTVNGLQILPTVNASGQGTKYINGIALGTPTITKCQSGNCIIDGLRINTLDTSNSASNVYSTGIDIQSSGVSSGVLKGINISAITNRSGAETAIDIGGGWDTALRINGVAIFDGSGNLLVGTPGSGTTTIGTIDSQTKSLNGAVISGAGLYLQSADTNYPGLVTNGTQSFAGNKTFVSGSGVNTSAFTIQNASSSNIFNVNTDTNTQLIRNGGFEQSTNGWSAKGSATIAMSDSGTSQSGSRFLNINTTAAASDGVKYTFMFKPSTSYSVSFYAKATSATGANMAFGRADDGSTDTTCASSQTFSTSWAQFTCSFTTGGTISNNPYFFIHQADATARTFMIDSVSLVQSSSAIAYNSGGNNIDIASQYSNITLNNSLNGEIQPWQSSPNQLPAIMDTGTTVVANGYIYEVGGYIGGFSSTIYYAKLNADGTVGSWSTNTANPIPQGLAGHATVVYNGYMYVVGGYNGSTEVSTVYYAKINTDGSIGQWITNPNSLPIATRDQGTFVANGYIYAIGGHTTTTTGSVYYAKINTDGSVGQWKLNANSITAREQINYGTVTANRYIYVIGGDNGGRTNTVQYAALNADGSTGTWTTLAATPLPTSLDYVNAIVLNGYIYAIDGGDQSENNGSSAIYYAKLNSDGTLGSWNTSANSLPFPIAGSVSTTNNGYIYTIGGYDGSASQKTVFYTSTARTSIYGTLDLVGLSEQNLNGLGATGGTLTAGNTNILGNLNVNNNVSFWNGLSVMGPANISFYDGSTNPSTSNVSGLYIAGTINTSGAGTKNITSFLAGVPTITACQSGACIIDSFKAITTGSSVSSLITQNGLDVQSTGISAGTLNGVNIAGIIGGSGIETAIKIGSGWDAVLSVNGNTIIDGNGTIVSGFNSNSDLVIGKRTDSGGTNSDFGTVSTSVFTGNICGTDNTEAVSTATIYNGSLYVGTNKSNAGEVCRYNGGTSWTRVMPSAGTLISGSDTSIDQVTNLIEYNGAMYAGINEAGSAAMYKYGGSTNWSRVNSAKGAFKTTTAIDSISAMAVWNGVLYIGTSKSNSAEVYRYDGGSTFTPINTTAGRFGTTTSIDTVSSMTVYDNQLYIGTTEANSAEVYRYDGGTGTSVFTPINTTAGTFNSTSSIDGVVAMQVYNGALYIGTSELAKAEVYRYDGGTGAAVFTVLNGTPGTFSSQTSHDSAKSFAIYNGKLYMGTSYLATGTIAVAELLRYDGGSTWTPMNTTPGSFNGSTNNYGIDALIQLQDTLYIGTEKPTFGNMYNFNAVSSNSYAIKFQANPLLAGSDTQQSGYPNYGQIYFDASQNARGNGQSSNTGTFIFSHGIATNTGAYDVAEDYPTRDDTLAAGDIVSVDPNERGFVRKSLSNGNADLLGVYSENPGFRLSQQETSINGGTAIPIALAGRVPVKVTSENGTIKAGDPITASSISGVGMKSTGNERIVGMAMEDYTNSDKTAVGKILVFVNPSFHTDPTQIANEVSQKAIDNLRNDPDLSTKLSSAFLAKLDSDFASQSAELALQGADQSTIDSLAAQSTASISAKLAAIKLNPDGTVDIPNLKLDNTSKSPSVRDLFSRLQSLESQAQSFEASNSAILALQSKVNNLFKDVDILKTGQQTASIAANLTSIPSVLGTSSDQIATLSSLLVTDNANFNNVGITGNLNIGLLNIVGGTDATSSAEISTLAGPLKLQANSLGNVDIMGGKILIDTQGNLVVKESVTTKELKIDTTDVASATVGEATLQAGQTALNIPTTAVKTGSHIFITPKSKTSIQLSVTEQLEGQSFKVEIPQAQTTDIKFSWFIVN